MKLEIWISFELTINMQKREVEVLWFLKVSCAFCNAFHHPQCQLDNGEINVFSFAFRANCLLTFIHKNATELSFSHFVSSFAID
jgi:hypothetical protein